MDQTSLISPYALLHLFHFLLLLKIHVQPLWYPLNCFLEYLPILLLSLSKALELHQSQLISRKSQFLLVCLKVFIFLIGLQDLPWKVQLNFKVWKFPRKLFHQPDASFSLPCSLQHFHFPLFRKISKAHSQ